MKSRAFFCFDPVVVMVLAFSRPMAMEGVRNGSFCLTYRKGMGLIFPNQDVDIKWQHKRSGGRLQEPRPEFSFLAYDIIGPGIGLAGDGVEKTEKAATSWPFRCALDVP